MSKIYSVYLQNQEGSSLRVFIDEEEALKEYERLLKEYSKQHPCNIVEIFTNILKTNKEN